MYSQKRDPELNVRCPTCDAAPGEPCRSHRAISIHAARRSGLDDLERQANRILRRGGYNYRGEPRG